MYATRLRVLLIFYLPLQGEDQGGGDHYSPAPLFFNLFKHSLYAVLSTIWRCLGSHSLTLLTHFVIITAPITHPELEGQDYMLPYQERFIQLCIQYQALKFGTFTLKSGRISPYFFNAGSFNTGKALQEIGSCYAAAIEHSQLQYDSIFGPAYKGIPLGTATCIAFAKQYNKDIPLSFDRKEAKDHGEQGMMMGAPLKGKVLILDDVITAGTAKYQALNMIQQAGAQATGIIVALDREERFNDQPLSASQLIEQQFGIPVISIIKLSDIIEYVKQGSTSKGLEELKAYQAQYGILQD